MSCRPANLQEYDKPYFDFDSLVNKQIQMFSTRKDSIRKVAELDAKTSVSSFVIDSTHLAHEWDVFRQLDWINKPLFKGNYEITEGADTKSNLMVRSYVAKKSSNQSIKFAVPFVHFYYQDDFQGEAGAELYFDSELSGDHGLRLVEVDARNKIISENVTRPPVQGKNIKLSIDSRIQHVLHENIKQVAQDVGFIGGAGVIMDINTGQVIAITSYPEYSSQIMSDKSDSNAVKAMLNDKSLPFLDRAIDGLYAPGSVVKIFIALGVLNEKIVTPEQIIMTNGSISLPNLYDSTKSTIFRDWKNHGPLDMRHALSVSSDVYFYTVGGGFENQKGLGIRKIDEYLKMFGFGTTTLDNSNSLLLGKAGTIPTPEWKKKTFGEAWYVGNTYHTSIGQYGFQVTPIQIARAVSAVANFGMIYSPTILADQSPNIESEISIPKSYFDVVHDGMRLSVTDGTSKSLNIPKFEIAAKSGTAELGYSKEKINSWMTGFWPYKNPRYAFVVMLEKGTVHYQIGAGAVMRQTLDWMYENTPEYFDNRVRNDPEKGGDI